MTLTSLDHSATLALNFDGGLLLDRIMWFASEKVAWAPLYLFLLWLVAREYGWKYMLVILLAVVVGVALSDQICNYFKDTYQVLRPTRVDGVKEQLHSVWHPIRQAFCSFGPYGTVSAHAATTMSIFMVVGLGALKRFRLYWYLMPVWVVFVGYSRIYLGAHFLSQVLFGWLLGALLGFVLVWFLGRIPQVQRLKRGKR